MAVELLELVVVLWVGSVAGAVELAVESVVGAVDEVELAGRLLVVTA